MSMYDKSHYNKKEKKNEMNCQCQQVTCHRGSTVLVDWQKVTPRHAGSAPALTLKKLKVPLIDALWTDGSSSKVTINWQGPISFTKV